MLMGRYVEVGGGGCVMLTCMCVGVGGGVCVMLMGRYVGHCFY